MVEQISSLKTGVKYKDTPIGKVPVDWEVTSINDICKIRRGASPRPIGDSSFFSNTGRGWIRIADVTSTYKHLKKTIQCLSEKGVSKSVKVDPGDLIMSICATIGKPVIVDIEACIHDGFVLFSELSPKINKEYLFYFLQKIEKQIAVKGQIGTQGNLNTNIVRKTSFPLPPLQEQKNIVQIISTLDDAIEKTTRIIAKTKELKRALMPKLFTQGIDHKEFKRTVIGEIPEKWNIYRLKDISKKFYNGGTPNTTNEKYWDGNIPWITGADFENQKINIIRKYITNEGVENSSTNVVPKGNLLVVTRTGVGKLAIAPFDIAISQDITGIIFDLQKALPSYIYWYLDYKTNRLKSLIQGTSINGILRGDLESFIITLPSVNEQKIIADMLFSIEEKIEKESNHLEQLKLLKKGLMQILLTGKLRVTV